ncbi:MAG: ATP-binding protein, partial [Candidatus Acidulodesulfobacterium sp.]
MADFLENIIRFHASIINDTPLSFTRYLYDKIDFNERLIGIVGQRGVGKSTLMLQYLKKNFTDPEEGLYLSLDNPIAAGINLTLFAEDFVAKNGKLLVLDEVHKYNNFHQHIKSIYDSFKKLKIIFSGSSELHLKKDGVDLSRRAIVYNMNGLSFREFINLETGLNFPTLSIKDIIENHYEVSLNITSQIKPLSYFGKYLNYGYYPFYKENKSGYLIKLYNVINEVLEGDMVILGLIHPSHIHKIKKLLDILCSSDPFKINIEKLAASAEIDRNTVYKYIKNLNESHLITVLYQKAKGYGIMTKPEKLYLNNPNLVYALCNNNSLGTIREIFFINQVSAVQKVNSHKSGDFIVDDKFIFEIGGKNKDFSQIKDIENSFLALDGIETG